MLIYDFPAPPVINEPLDLTACEGDEPLGLVSSYGVGNQWVLDSMLIPGASRFELNGTTWPNGIYPIELVTGTKSLMGRLVKQ